jgi:hypothetical protein
MSILKQSKASRWSPSKKYLLRTCRCSSSESEKHSQQGECGTHQGQEPRSNLEQQIMRQRKQTEEDQQKQKLIERVNPRYCQRLHPGANVLTLQIKRINVLVMYTANAEAQ